MTLRPFFPCSSARSVLYYSQKSMRPLQELPKTRRASFAGVLLPFIVGVLGGIVNTVLGFYVAHLLSR